MIIIDLFDIDFHIFTVIKFLFNLGVRFKYIYKNHDNSVGSSYFFVDVHVSAGTSSNLESTSKSKLVQYNNAWNQFRHETLSSDPDKYRHLMTLYQQINHSRQGQPKVFVFGINYDVYLDS